MDDYRYHHFARQLYVLCFGAYATSYIGRLNFTACMSDMISQGTIDKSFGGLIASAFFISYALGQFFNGRIGDKIQPKAMIFIGLMGAGICNLFFGLASSAPVLLVLWCLNGYCNSMLWSPCIRCFSEYLDNEHKKLTVHIAVSIPAGTLLAYLISSAVLKFFHWRAVFFVSSVILMAASAVWLIGMSRLDGSFSDAKARVCAEQRPEGAGQTAPNAKLWRLVVSNGIVFVMVSILFNGILKDSVTAWVPVFLVENYAIDSALSSLVSVILPVINLFGAYAANYMNRRIFHNELKSSMALFSVSALSFVLLLTVGRLHFILGAALFALSTSAMLGVNTMFLTYIPLRFASTGKSSSMTGLLDSLSYASSALSGATIGMVAQRFGWNVIILSWIGTAVCGFAACAAGVRTWGKARYRYSSAE